MSRHHDKTIHTAQQTAAEVGLPPDRTAPRTRAEVESFVKGFNLSAPAVRRIVDEWLADTGRATTTAYNAGYESATYDQY